jgi:two-component sensor histidine kinase
VAAPTYKDSDGADNLALAVVMATDAFVLLLDDDLRVKGASASFCDAFQLPPRAVPGRRLAELGGGEWDAPQLTSLLSATASGYAEVEAHELDLHPANQPIRHLRLNARKLDYGVAEPSRLLLTIMDVTAALAEEKARADLLQEKDVLLQEVQHRVANSLQIIASVLMQSARKVQSEETRGHLRDAHSRVMSIAAVQQHLAASRIGQVELRPYFTQLCLSLAASMISDEKAIVLEVEADESAVSADASVSLGLIVTELVINALKHAFPHHRHGRIKVVYRADGDGWRLSVTDDGVGVIAKTAAAKIGLGTSIVQALANKLKARVEITDATPGTRVSIVCG